MSECREWQEYRDKFGYGIKWSQGRPRRAHRLAYVEHHGMSLGEIKGRVVMHLCDNTSCVNPDHLRLGTQADNVADMVGKGRQNHAAGMKHSNARLTDAEVLAIRFLHAAAGTSKEQLGRTFGVSGVQVGRIIKRESWNHV